MKPSKNGFSKRKGGSVISHRWIVISLGSFAIFLSSVMNFNFNIAILAMVNQSDVSTTMIGSDECLTTLHESYHHNKTTSFAPVSGGKYLWDPYVQGVLLGAINYGFLGTQIFGGVLSEKCGAKWIAGVGTMTSALFSTLTPTAAELGVPFLMATRIALGMSQGLIAPALYALTAQWIPTQERHLAVMAITLCAMMGTSFGAILTGYLCNTTIMGGWPSSFYIPSIVVGIFLILWTCLVHSSPEENRNISKEEIMFIRNIEEPLQLKTKKNSHEIPWCSLLSSGPFLALAILRFAHGWFLFTDATATPMYLDSVLGFTVVENGTINGIMYFVATLGTLSGILSNQLRKKTNWSVTSIRKIYIFIAYGGCAICWSIIPLAGCNKYLTVGLFLTAKCLYSVSYSADSVVFLDIAPQFAGTLFGITTTLGSSCGFLSPMFTGYITENDVSIDQWSYVFYTNSAICILGLMCFLIWGSAEVQPWAKNEPDDERLTTNENSIYSDYGSLSVTNDFCDA